MPAISARSLRFAVALSFPGDRRDFVAGVARSLANVLGEQRVLYDQYFEAEFARLDLDVYLPKLYKTEAELMVVFLCPEYAAKRWCRLEWRQVRQLLATVAQGRVMLLSFGNPGDLSELGISEGDGYLDIGTRTAEVIAEKIRERLHLNQGAVEPRPTQEPARPILGDLTEKADAHGLVQVRYQVQGATEQREMSGYRFRGRLVLTAVPAASGGSPRAFEIGCLKQGGLVHAQSIGSGEALLLLEAASALEGDADACSPLCGWPDPAREIPCCVLWCGSGSEARQAQGVLHPSDGSEAAGRRHLTLSDVKAEPIIGASVFCGGRLVGLVSTGPGPHGHTVELVRPLLREPAFAAKIGWPPPFSVLQPLRREVTRSLQSSELVRILAKQLKLPPTATVDAVATELLWTGAEEVLAMLCVAADQHKLSPDDPRPGPVRRLLELVLPYCFDWAAPVAEIERVQTKNARVVTLAASRKALCELAMAGGTGRRASLEVCGADRVIIGHGAVVPEGGRDSDGSQLLKDILVHLAQKLGLIDDLGRRFDQQELERLRDDVLGSLQLIEATYRRREGIQSFDVTQPLCYVVTTSESLTVTEVANKLPGVCIVRLVQGAGMGKFEAFLEKGIRRIIELDNQPAKAT
jgi:hypothetical protein